MRRESTKHPRWMNPYGVPVNHAVYRGEVGQPPIEGLTQLADATGPATVAATDDRTATARLSAMLRQDYAPLEPSVPDYPPARGLGYRIPILPDDEARRRQMTQVLGQPQTPEEKEAALMKRLVSKAMTEQARDTQGSEKLGSLQENSATKEQANAGETDPVLVTMRKRKRHRPPTKVFDAGRPTNVSVDASAKFEALEFIPNGLDERDAMFRRPVEANWSFWEYLRASDDAKLWVKGYHPHNTRKDAVRHALWSFRVTRKYTSEIAKEFGDAHEVTEVNKIGERLMDLYNNNVGRRLAMDPRNRDRDAKDVIMEALQNGELQTAPFKILPGTEGKFGQR